MTKVEFTIPVHSVNNTIREEAETKAKEAYVMTLLKYAQILHQGEKPGFLRMTNGQTLYFWLRNPVFLVLLRMVQDLSMEKLAVVRLVNY